MLILTRRVGEALMIDLQATTDPGTPAAELFAAGPIVVTVTASKGTQVRIGIQADRRFRILRSEVHGRS